MNQMLALDAKEQIRQTVDIADLAGSYNLSLRRAGRNFVAHCPWHDDSRPSLQINSERQSFKCWVCDIGGDIFSFVMKMEGIEFREALEMLAERAGVTLQPLNAGTSAEQLAGGPGDKRTLLRAMAWAETQFHQCLLEAPEAQPARDYLSERGISDETIQKFQLGFTPNRWDWLTGRSQNTEFTNAVLERVGVLIRKEETDRYYDRFRGRVMFSIRDARGRPIACGGRVLPQLADEHSGGKYINSPETPLFAKSRELYALDHAGTAIRKQGQVIVVEGYTDALMAHQHGVENVIAVLGTALGPAHLPVLRRYSDSIVLVLDGDEAGRRRTNEILELFVAQQIDLRILTLPEGVDPCDFIASHGSDHFRGLVDTAVDALEHKLNMESNGLDVSTDTHRSTQAAERVLTTLAQARPGAGMASSSMLLREQQMLSRTARHFRLPEDGLRNRLVELRRKTTRKSLTSPNLAGVQAGQDTPPPAPTMASWAQWERELLEIVLLDAEQLSTLSQQIEVSSLTSPIARRMYELCIELWRDGNHPLYEALMVRIDNPEIKNLLVQLDDASQAKSASDMSLRLHDLGEAYRKHTGVESSDAPNDSLSEDIDDDAALANFFSQKRPTQLSEYQRRKS